MNSKYRALISVSEKQGLDQLVPELIKAQFEILSTGGTAKHIRSLGFPVTEISDYTQSPEIMSGRVKTLHPKIYASILSRGEQDANEMALIGAESIHLVVVNLYPFQQVAQCETSSFETIIENIDIGGPTMVRAAAKNHQTMTILTDPNDYRLVIDGLPELPNLDKRRRLAYKAYAYTATYDVHIANWFADMVEPDAFSPTLHLSAKRQAVLRYGENPHQNAASYQSDEIIQEANVFNTIQHQGKSLSYNNLVDSDAALNCVKRFTECACVIVKHANPCGVAVGSTPLVAYQKAYQTDPTSAFGGIIAFNQKVDEVLAKTIVNQQFVEVIIGPSFSKKAITAFKTKNNIRVLACEGVMGCLPGQKLTHLTGGFLIQDRDVSPPVEWRVVTERKPNRKQLKDVEFAWEVVQHVKSNAIVCAINQQTLGIGAGQMSRIYSAKIAYLKAAHEGLELSGSVLASDAFFPFRDVIETASEHKISVIVQPGGSVNDEDVIAAANEHNMIMLTTGMRHFRH